MSEGHTGSSATDPVLDEWAREPYGVLDTPVAVVDSARQPIPPLGAVPGAGFPPRQSSAESASQIAVLAFDSTGTCTLAQGALFAGHESLVGRSAAVALTAVGVDDAASCVERVLADHAMVGAYRLNGRWLEVHHQPLRDALGRASGGIVVVTDVTYQRRTLRQLERSERRLRAVVDSAPVTIISFDTGMVCRFAAGQLGLEPLVGRRLAQVYEEAGAAAAVRNLRRTLAGEAFMVRRRVGVRWYDAHYRPIVENGKVTGGVLVAVDVTDQQRARDLSDAAGNVLERIAAGASLGDIVSAAAGIVVDRMPGAACLVFTTNQQGNRLLLAGSAGLPSTRADHLAARPIDAVGGLTGEAARTGRQVEASDGDDDDLLNDGAGGRLSATYAVPITGQLSGALFAVLTLYLPEPRAVLDDERDVVVRAARLVQLGVGKQRVLDQLARAALHDPLTGLPNRALMLDRLDQCLAKRREGHGLAVVFCDLDHFKLVNDTFGHATGDRLLTIVAARIRDALRPGDTVARFGGDEFVVLCDGVSSVAESVNVAERILAVIAEPLLLEDRDMRVGASAGVVVDFGSGRAGEVLLADADTAMYRAKARGRGRAEIFEEAMRAAATSRLETEIAMRRAIDRSQFALHFQPQLSMRTGAAIGVEALARWPRRGARVCPPAKFIPVAEDSGLIKELGRWILHEACRAAAQWARDGHEVPVSVNLSALQLRGDLVTEVREALDESGLAPHLLCLELTESVLIHDTTRIGQLLEELHGTGVRLSVDDFGTGHSSLLLLRCLPVDTLKIDGVFVQGLADRPSDDAIIKAVIDLGRGLDLMVIAEGIETAAQHERLLALGCPAAQGFLYSKPVPADQLRQWLDQNPPSA